MISFQGSEGHQYVESPGHQRNNETACDQTAWSITVLGIAKVGGMSPWTVGIQEEEVIGPVYRHVIHRREGVGWIGPDGGDGYDPANWEDRWIEERYWYHHTIGDIYKHEIETSCDGIIYSWEIADTGSVSESSATNTCAITLPGGGDGTPVETIADTIYTYTRISDVNPIVHIHDTHTLSDIAYPPTELDAFEFMNTVDLVGDNAIVVSGVTRRTGLGAVAPDSTVPFIVAEYVRSAGGVVIANSTTPTYTALLLNEVGVVGGQNSANNGSHGGATTAWSQPVTTLMKGVSVRFYMQACKKKIGLHDRRLVEVHYLYTDALTEEEVTGWTSYWDLGFHTNGYWNERLEECVSGVELSTSAAGEPCNGAPYPPDHCLYTRIYTPDDCLFVWGFLRLTLNCDAIPSYC